MNEDLVRQLFPYKMAQIEEGNCPICTKPINMEDFRTDADRKEYEISKLCQSCIDDMFGVKKASKIRAIKKENHQLAKEYNDRMREDS